MNVSSTFKRTSFGRREDSSKRLSPLRDIAKVRTKLNKGYALQARNASADR